MKYFLGLSHFNFSVFMLTFIGVSLFTSTSVFADTRVRIIDGDTLQIAEKTYRLNGIDAPEIGQNCTSETGNWPCGKIAATRLFELTALGKVQCETHSVDKYSRSIATCYTGDTDLGGQLVQEGLAWAFRRYTEAYDAHEVAAKNAKIGIWQHSNQPAWEFREQRWQAAAENSGLPGCPIKGNISPNGKIYHAPWSPWYSRTRINQATGERWFCDESEALRAGWRAPYWP